MITVKTWKNPKLKTLFDDAHNAALQGIGLHLQDATSTNTHKQTGTLRNSWNCKTQKWWSGFGRQATIKPKIALTTEQEVSNPSKDRVRVGSNLVYAKPYNDRFAVLEITADQENSNIGKIANVAYKKIIGT